MKKIWYAPNGFEAYGEEEIKAVEKCLRDSILAGFGKYSIEFEEKVAAYFGKKHGLFVNSGSSACMLALEALDLEKGSEVVTPACTFSTTVAPIIQLGFKPVFCDVELDAYVPSVEQIFEKVTSKTKVLMLPNLVGNVLDWKGIRTKLKEINREDIYLIEDSADTLTYTEESDISTTSFYASHVITACGTGGMVMFNNIKHHKRATMFRDWGRIGTNVEDMTQRFNYNVDDIPYDFKFLYGCHGYNFKSSEVNAAFGLVQFERLPKFLEIRRQNVKRYLENLKGVPGIILPNDSRTPNWLAFPIQVKNRLALATYLENNDIQTRVIFSGNITRHPAYREYLEEYTNSDIIMRDGILLGAHHGMTLEDVDRVCSLIKDFLNLST
uniref:DegT/DnrJ/EryC1/StrS aminotransferase family protein n=1 Tax=viral metagenome TaxID=1070528 RepID=A0A6C0IBF3_9ZZZZ